MSEMGSAPTLERRRRRSGGLAAWFVLAFVVCAGGAVAAAEIDGVTRRDEPLRDARRGIERRFDAALQEAVDQANESGSVCDVAALRSALRDAFAWPFIGHSITESLDADETLDRRRVLRSDSIYRDLGLLDGVSLHWKDLSSVVRVGDTVMGVDKIGHFVVEGWAYFERSQLDGEGVDAAMTWGEDTEDTYFGRYTTGVRSYADLVANFEGLRFWSRLVGEGADPLAKRSRRARPYVKCGRRLGLFGERRFRVVRGFDLDDYVTPVWDEAVNCCSYRTPEIEAMVDARIAELSQAMGTDLTCPVDPGACGAARKRYGAFALRLLHPKCLAAEPPSRPWWRIW